MIKRQRIMIIALAAVFAVLTAAYFIIVRPMTADDKPEDTTIHVDPGEGTYGNSMLMFPQVSREEMQSIEVKNSKGTFKFVYNDEIGDFEIEGHESLATNALLFTQLIVNTGFPHVVEKITDHVTDDELVTYGFEGEKADPATYTVTMRDGGYHTVTIGRKVLSGGGFYAMYEGRDAVYILNESLEKTLFASVEDMLSPVVTGGISMSSYYNMDHFTIKHYGEDFIVCRNLTSDELAETESTALAESITVRPAGYTLSMSYDDTLQLLSSYEGESVAAIGLTDENLEKYGLKDKPYEISYDYDGFKFGITVSEPVDGYYYAATEMFGLIVKVPEADFEFLTWDLKHWIEPLVFSRSIAYVESIEIESEPFNDTFRLTHRPNDDPSLIVVGDECGQIRDIPNFREFYKTLLYLRLQDYAPDDIEVSDDDCILRFTIKTGKSETEYAFYRYSTRRCLLTINGEGQFYVLADTAEKIISDAQKVIDGVPIDSVGKT